MLDGKDVSQAILSADPPVTEIDLGPLAQIETTLTLDNQRYFVVRRDNQIALFSAACPHMGGEVRDLGDCFECPLHGWRFDRITGRSLNAAGAALAEIPTRQRAGRLYARIARRSEPGISAPLVSAPTDLSIELLVHSSLKIETKSFSLVTDPWLAGPAMLGAWIPYPPPVSTVMDPAPDAVWISHEHSDHFHEPTLAQLDLNTPIYFPDFPNQRIRNRLKRLGFTRVHAMPFGDRIEIAPNFFLTCYEPASLWNDSIVLIEVDGYRLLNLNDAGLNRRLAAMLGPVDAVASAFTPGASGYPLTWSHLTAEKQDEILQRSCAGMLQMLREAVRLYGCKSFLPYAGHFALWHPLHRKYVSRMLKNSLGDVTSALADLPVQVVDLLPGESWRPSSKKITRALQERRRLFAPEQISEYLDRTFNQAAFDRWHSPGADLSPLTPGSLDSHFLRLNDVPEMVFCEDLRVAVLATDLSLEQVVFDRLYEVSGGRLRILPDGDSTSANLTMRVPASVLARIVQEDLSWDESHIGYWCGFSRSPDIFHGGFWRLIQAPYYRKTVGALPVSTEKLISPGTCVGWLVERHGAQAERILRRYGMYCGGCHHASAETLNQAAATHGIDSIQAQRLIEELNAALIPGQIERNVP